MKKAIVIGASSGIGKELSRILSESGASVGIAARRLPLLNQVADSLSGEVFVKQIDVMSPQAAMTSLSSLIDEMGGVDLIVIASGVGNINKELDWQLEDECIATNVSGFTAMANVAMKYFLVKGEGHFVGISSVAALRGSNDAPSYHASKAYMSNYLEGLRKKVEKSNYPIAVTEIIPGFVDTRMAKGEGLFWVASPENAARQIYQAILKKKSKAYITKRWGIIAWLLKNMPAAIYNRL